MYKGMPAVHECRVFIIIKETTAAGIKASESLCLPQLNR